MSIRLEAFLARLYIDEGAREAYRADPGGETARAGLNASEHAAVCRLDPVDLRLAARSFEHKRAHEAARGRRWREYLTGWNGSRRLQGIIDWAAGRE